MKRRIALKNLGFVTGGLVLLPSCDFSDKSASTALNKLNITATQEKVVTTLVDMLLPETDSPGGLSVNAHNFVWVYIDECSSPEDQKAFLNGLSVFEKYVGKTSLDTMSQDEQSSFFNELKNDASAKNAFEFVNWIKSLAVWCYTSSEYFMTQEMPYRLVPGAGSYMTCKTIDPNQKINTNA